MKKNLTTPLTLVAVLALSLGLTFGLYTFVKNDINATLSSKFQSQTDQIASFIQHRMDLYSNVVY
ncbi:MAG TPA: hypothetical protein VGP13_02110, partial [Candidatus Paceibacterota bacterium]|nr:hypothetical protein [Candidatus Paceibacterota bacterium]